MTKLLRTRRGKVNSTKIVRYEKQMEEFKKKGYYTREDGTKSNEVEIGKKRRSSKGAKKGTVKPAGDKGRKKKSSASKSKGKSQAKATGKSGSKPQSGAKKNKKEAEESANELSLEDSD